MVIVMRKSKIWVKGFYFLFLMFGMITASLFLNIGIIDSSKNDNKDITNEITNVTDNDLKVSDYSASYFNNSNTS